jgi:hypothetical protein
LLRNRGRIHDGPSQPISPKKFLHAESVSENFSIQMITLTALFRFMTMKGKKGKQKKKSQLHS